MNDKPPKGEPTDKISINSSQPSPGTTVLTGTGQPIPWGTTNPSPGETGKSPPPPPKPKK